MSLLAQPLRNEKKKMVSFLGLVLPLHSRKAMTSALNTPENACNSSSQELRRLCKQVQLKEALCILRFMDERADFSTYDSLLQWCFTEKALPEAKLVHAHMIQTGFKCSDASVGNKLVTMYAKCGNLVDGRMIFDQMPERDVVSWTIVIAAYARHEHVEEAVALFYQMHRSYIKPNQFTFASVLPAFANLASLEKGKEIHEKIIRSGFQSNVFVANALVDMYSKCGNIEDARHLFDKMHQRNVISWTAIITGYAQNGNGDETLKLFREMQLLGVKPNSKTFASVLPACTRLSALEQGVEIHGEIVRSGFHSDIFVGNALVDMYAKCGSVEIARKLFDKMHQRNDVSWTAMIAGYAQNGNVDEALKLFQKMPKRNVVSWTAMIARHAQSGLGDKALKLFRQMQLAAVQPNSKTFASLLPACANLAALERGKEVHEAIIRSGFHSDVFVGSALVDMYAKCGNIGYARKLFDKMPQRDVVSWTVMIAGYAMHGCGKEALRVFEQMQHSGTNPDQVTFLGVLSACCHAGLVDEGKQYFASMSQYYCITPAMEHYGCMVDLLGRCGHLDEAQYFINKMPIKPDATVWVCLLGACKIHNNIELGKHVAEFIFDLNPENAAPYVLLSNIFAAAGRWDDIEKVRKMMKDRRVRKKPGCSWIEVNKQVHAFIT
eukprot:Gb_24666 [translate_table: standard]